MDPVSLPDQIRDGCAWVAARASAVTIEERQVERYAAGLTAPASMPDVDEELNPGRDRESRAAFAICLNAINFGSGWWPTIRKRPGHSGFFTIAAGLGERFRERGPWSAGEHLGAEHGGSFTAAVDSVGSSAPALAGLLAGWEAFADVSVYEERPVPFFKRAQLAAADLARADRQDRGR